MALGARRGHRHGPDAPREKRLTIDLDGAAVPLRLIRNPRARRIILRVDPHSDGAVVVLPPWADWAQGADLALRETAWLRERLAALPRRVAFADGVVIPVLGHDHVIRHRPGRGRPVAAADGEIAVTGDQSHLARRLTDWLRRRARAEIEPRSREKAERIGRVPASITLRDTRSRWGSCSVKGGLSFSWRLILAPEPVLDYVVAHEVAHLRHHNHGPEFWDTAARLTGDVAAARDWLRRQGPALHRYG